MSRKRSSETGPPTLLCFWIESGHLSPENNYSGSWTCCVIRDKGLSSSDQNAAGLEVTGRFRNLPDQASIPDALMDTNQARGYSDLTSTSVGRMAGSPPSCSHLFSCHGNEFAVQSYLFVTLLLFQDRKPQANTIAKTNKAVFRGIKEDLFGSIRKYPAYIGSNRPGLVTLIRKTLL